LSRTGRANLARFVWAGVAVAGALSLAVAIALERWQNQRRRVRRPAAAAGPRSSSFFDDHLDEPRCAPSCEKDIEGKKLKITRRPCPVSRRRLGNFSFSFFLMVVREGRGNWR